MNSSFDGNSQAFNQMKKSKVCLLKFEDESNLRKNLRGSMYFDELCDLTKIYFSLSYNSTNFITQ